MSSSGKVETLAAGALQSRLLFTCSYDGAPWSGWQSQPSGRTVQDCIEAAFARILKSPLRIHAAGRTDAGVHALGQCFHADIPSPCRLSPADWLAALNAHLPPSVRILHVQPVAPDFHARFSAIAKIYEYRIFCGCVLPPHSAGRAWLCPRPLDLSVLRTVLELFCGEHDFRCFCARRGNEPVPLPPGFFTRTISEASFTLSDELLSLHFCGNGFLYKMVRMLVASAVRAASATCPVSDVRVALDNPLGSHPRFCAPPDGLFLVRILYPDPYLSQ